MEGNAYRSQFRYHERIGYWFRPNLYLRVPGNGHEGASYTIVTNSLGARTRHEPDPGRRGRPRALFIGCSMTAGDGVGNQYRFTDLVEERLGWIECHNYGLSGSGHDQQVLVHEEFASRVAPDVLVLSPFTGCIDRNLFDHRMSYDPLTKRRIRRPKPFFTLETGELALRNVPVPRRGLPLSEDGGTGAEASAAGSTSVRRLGAATARYALGLRGRFGGLQFPAYADPSEPAYALARALLVRILRSSTARNRILMPIPTRQAALDPRRGHYPEFFATVARAGDAEYLDPIEHFATLPRSSRALLYFGDDGHLTERGHVEIARHLAPTLDRTAPDRTGEERI